MRTYIPTAEVCSKLFTAGVEPSELEDDPIQTCRSY